MKHFVLMLGVVVFVFSGSCFVAAGQPAEPIDPYVGLAFPSADKIMDGIFYYCQVPVNRIFGKVQDPAHKAAYHVYAQDESTWANVLCFTVIKTDANYWVLNCSPCYLENVYLPTGLILKKY